MTKDYFRSSRSASVSSGYRMLRGLLRLWITIFLGKMRVLAADDLPKSTPAVFVVTQAATFIDALLLIAATQRQLRCLVDRKIIGGVFGRFLARGLGMIPYEQEGEGWRGAVETACNILGNLGSIAVFADVRSGETQEGIRFAPTAAMITLEAESRNANQLDALVVPVHLFFPVAKLRKRELLAYFDRRIPTQTYMLPGKALEERRHALCAALEEACRKNVFRLQPQDVGNFLADLEAVLLSDLREDFASRDNWKQKVEDFQLSEFVRRWVEQMNFLHPVELVLLRESQSDYREALRQASLEQLEVETAAAWVQAAAWRALGWVETVTGFPIALYGLANHLLAGLFLQVAGLGKKKNEINRVTLWTSRVAVVLVFYAVQVILSDHFLGRAAAGYYAVSLPLSALYLWRYAWVFEHRTRLLVLHAFATRRANEARRRRKEFVQELNAARDAYIEAMELAH
jgi:1-acyl-sn-glycerol-3-phosphate acyltransferase